MKQTVTITFCLLLVLLWNSQCLTADEVDSFCYCDLTPDTCDANCCCDNNCSLVKYNLLRLHSKDCNVREDLVPFFALMLSIISESIPNSMKTIVITIISQMPSKRNLV